MDTNTRLEAPVSALAERFDPVAVALVGGGLFGLATGTVPHAGWLVALGCWLALQHLLVVPAHEHDL